MGNLFLQICNRVRHIQIEQRIHRYRGRQLSHAEIGEEVMAKFIEQLADVANVEKAPFMEGKWLNAVLASKCKK